MANDAIRADSAHLAHDCARQLVQAFADYNAEFRTITRRAPQRFDSRDWKGSQRDAVERIDLYDGFVNRTIAQMRLRLGEDALDRALWSEIRTQFAAQIESLPDKEFTKTFFSSITRRLFGTVGVAADIEFHAADLDPLASVTSTVVTNTYINRGSLQLTFEDLLGDLRFRSRWRDFDKSLAHVTADIAAHLQRIGERRAIQKVEVIRPVFFQIMRAYVVGRLVGRNFALPLVIALKNTEGGVLVDAVMLDEGDVSIVFSFTRSYFHVDLDRVGEAVLFLKSMLPRKPVSELFTVLGRAKQGKTERYRELMRHLAHTDDQFVHAPGERGLVMVCFTLPSFDVVFKIIRDRFPYPKNILREEVEAKYRLVFKHDRAGRRPQLRSSLHRAAHDAAQHLPAQRHARARREGGARLRAVHPRSRIHQHLRGRPAAQEFRGHAPRPRHLLRLRRAVSGDGLPLPRHARADESRGRDARRDVVLRRGQ